MISCRGESKILFKKEKNMLVVYFADISVLHGRIFSTLPISFF